MTDILMWHLVVTGALTGILLVVIAAQTVRAVGARAVRALRARPAPRLHQVREPHPT